MIHRIRRVALFALVLGAACSRHKGPETDIPRPDPIPLHVKNENFLDMNVYVVVSGVSRRVGTVPGNSVGDFKINWSIANGLPITVNAVPIGGRGSASSGALNVGIGQMIDFRIGSTLRQSAATVHEP